MSSFVPIGNPADIGAFEAALEVLGSMSGNGNLAAAEFFLNLEQVSVCLDVYRARTGNGNGNATAAIPPGSNNLNTSSSSSAMIPGPMLATPAESDMGLNPANPPGTFPMRDTAEGFTTAMAFLEPTMQDFLAQSDLDLGLLHPVDTFMSESGSLYTGHGL